MKDLKQRSKNWWNQNLANIVTVIGLISSALFLIAVIIEPKNLFKITLFAFIAGISDFVDGPIARHLKTESVVGSYLDRIRDRVFVYPALIVLALRNKNNIDGLNTVTNALIGAIIFLEIFIFISGSVAIFWHLKGCKKISLEPNESGKKKVFTGFIIILIWIFSLTFGDYSSLFSIKYSIFLIDFGLILMIFWGTKSLEEYIERSKNNKA